MRKIEMNCNLYRVKESFNADKIYDMVMLLNLKRGDYHIDEDDFFNTFSKDLEYAGTASDELFDDEGYFINIMNEFYITEGEAYLYEDYLLYMLENGEPFTPEYIIIEKPNI